MLLASRHICAPVHSTGLLFLKPSPEVTFCCLLRNSPSDAAVKFVSLGCPPWSREEKGHAAGPAAPLDTEHLETLGCFSSFLVHHFHSQPGSDPGGAVRGCCQSLPVLRSPFYSGALQEVICSVYLLARSPAPLLKSQNESPSVYRRALSLTQALSPSLQNIFPGLRGEKLSSIYGVAGRSVGL